MSRPVTGALLLLALACMPAPSTDTAADEQAIRATLEGWNQALSAGNDSLLATFYADSAALMPPGIPAIRGREGIRRFWASLWPMKATLAMTASKFTIGGDLAIEEGNWTWAMPMEGGLQRDHGKYLHTWQRTDGTWQIVQNIWNSDQRPEVAAAVTP